MRFTSAFATWLILLATLFLWSANWIVARAVRDDIAPGIATAGRVLVVLAILLPFTLGGLRAKLPALSRSEWALLAALGLTGGGTNMAVARLPWLEPRGDASGCRRGRRHHAFDAAMSTGLFATWLHKGPWSGHEALPQRL